MLPQIVAAGLLITLAFVAAAPAEAVSVTVCAPPNVDCASVDPGIAPVLGCANGNLNEVTWAACV